MIANYDLRSIISLALRENVVQLLLPAVAENSFNGHSSKQPSRRSLWKPRARCCSCLRKLGFGLKFIRKRLGIPSTSVRRILSKLPKPKRRAGHYNRFRSDLGQRKYHGPSKRPLSLKRITSLQLWAFKKESALFRRGDQSRHWRNHPEMLRQRTNIVARGVYRRAKAMKSNGFIASRIRIRISRVLRGVFKSAPTLRLMGCSWEQLRKHLQSQFTCGMAWDNYGKWEIDHIMPCGSFDLSDPEQQKACFHFSNLRPLWRRANRQKHATKPKSYQPELLIDLFHG